MRTDGAYPKAAEYKVSASGERNYTHYYDSSTYTSLWVAYPLEAKHMGSLSRPDNWSYNTLISTSDQIDIRTSSYDSSTYDRGHLIPNASRNGISEMQLQTFYVTNSVPQNSSFNSGVWQQLEAAVQTLGKSELIYVVTGVAFEKVGESKSITYITAKGDTRRVPIPNYFYKLVMRVKLNGDTVTSASTVGFWFDNAVPSSSYTAYSVSVDQVEAWTGFDFFANLPDTIELTAETNSSWSTLSNF